MFSTMPNIIDNRNRKWKILTDWKNLHNNSENLIQLKFSGKIFISENMCQENHQLAYKCRQLKNAGKNHSRCCWNNINVKLNERRYINLQRYITLLTSKNFLVLITDEFINSASFQLFYFLIFNFVPSP